MVDSVIPEVHNYGALFLTVGINSSEEHTIFLLVDDCAIYSSILVCMMILAPRTCCAVP